MLNSVLSSARRPTVSEPYSAARPEWYFLFLFQFLKFFPGGTEVWARLSFRACWCC
jgi:quinol-cytochrome oxidoreductase complex cytochrome b subunit